jgi:hypothetical protein
VIRGERHLDGNALGGTLWSVFGRDVTAVRGTCRSCGAENPMAALIARVGGPGDVLACPGCETVLLVVVHRPDGLLVTVGALLPLDL